MRKISEKSKKSCFRWSYWKTSFFPIKDLVPGFECLSTTLYSIFYRRTTIKLRKTELKSDGF